MLRDPEQAKLLARVDPKRKRSGKFNNKRVTLDGIRFDSIAEAAHYVQLRSDPEVLALRPCPEIPEKSVYKFAAGITYTPDFTYRKKGSSDRIVSDVKGRVTQAFRDKCKMMKHEFNIEVQQVWMDSKVARALVAAYQSTSTRK